MESQAADGSNSLSHKTIVVFDIVDQLAISIVDCSELIHWATGKEWREHGVINNVVGTPILLPTAPFSAGETSAHQPSVRGALTSSEIDFSCTMATSAQRDLQKGSKHSPCYSVWQREKMESWCRCFLEAALQDSWLRTGCWSPAPCPNTHMLNLYRDLTWEWETARRHCWQGDALRHGRAKIPKLQTWEQNCTFYGEVKTTKNTTDVCRDDLSSLSTPEMQEVKLELTTQRGWLVGECQEPSALWLSEGPSWTLASGGRRTAHLRSHCQQRSFTRSGCTRSRSYSPGNWAVCLSASWPPESGN